MSICNKSTPGYLDQAPIAPFDGPPIPIPYRRTKPGYRLYSVIEDGQDHDEVNRNDLHDWPFIVAR